MASGALLSLFTDGTTPESWVNYRMTSNFPSGNLKAKNITFLLLILKIDTAKLFYQQKMGLFGNKRKLQSGTNKLWQNHRQVAGVRGAGEGKACFFMEEKWYRGKAIMH